jgi:hypothetical protein
VAWTLRRCGGWSYVLICPRGRGLALNRGGRAGLRPRGLSCGPSAPQKDPANVDYEDLLLYSSTLAQEADGPRLGLQDPQRPSCCPPAQVPPEPHITTRTVTSAASACHLPPLLLSNPSLTLRTFARAVSAVPHFPCLALSFNSASVPIPNLGPMAI